MMDMITDLTFLYCEPHRKYHILSHPTGMIEMGINLFHLSAEEILAIWYHDAIYVASSPTNELDSANLFSDHFNDVTTLDKDLVRQIIMDTKNHVPTTDKSKAVLDLDLIGLSSSHREYWQNAKNIRFEYAKFSDEEWKIGRTKFLEKMLDRDQIYYTDSLKLFERGARHNMQYELNLLQVGNPQYK